LRTLREELAGTISRFKRIVPDGVKWVETSNLHVTIQFIGSVTPQQYETIKEGLVPLFQQLHYFEVFSPKIEVIPPRSPRLIWVKCSHNSNDLAHTVSEIRKFLQREKILIDIKPFKFHITLGRVKKRLPDSLWEEITSLDVEQGKWLIREAALYESWLHREGPEYLRLKKYSLQED